MIYLDNAATTNPKPAMVAQAVYRAVAYSSANPGRSGHQAAAQASEMVFGVRAKVAEFFHEPNLENVIFTANCTQSINMVLKGFLKPGDHVITSSVEHNAVMRPLHKLVADGITYETAQIFKDDMDATYRSFERLVKPETKMIICTHASNVFGVCLPIEKIGRLCRSKNIAFTVDAAQSAGIFPIDVEKMCIDFLCVAPHKGLLAPMGTGILIARKKLDTLIEGGTGNNSLSFEQPDDPPERYESGTVNLPGIAGIGAGVDFILNRGRGNIYSHEIRLIDRLYESLSQLSGVKLYMPKPEPGLTAPVLSFNIFNLPSEKIGKALSQAGFAIRPGLHCAPAAHRWMGTIDQGTVRVAPSYYTRMEDIDRFIKFIKSYLRNL